MSWRTVFKSHIQSLTWKWYHSLIWHWETQPFYGLSPLPTPHILLSYNILIRKVGSCVNIKSSPQIDNTHRQLKVVSFGGFFFFNFFWRFLCIFAYRKLANSISVCWCVGGRYSLKWMRWLLYASSKQRGGTHHRIDILFYSWCVAHYCRVSKKYIQTIIQMTVIANDQSSEDDFLNSGSWKEQNWRHTELSEVIL